MAKGPSGIHIGTNTKTEKQWLKEGRLLKSGAEGELFWTNGYRTISARYYSVDETVIATSSELKAAREPYLAAKREATRARRAYARAIKLRDNSIKDALLAPAIPCDNATKTVVFDVETTGLDFFQDEILQLYACDGDGNTLIHTYLHPYLKTEWSAAEKLHGISPAMVEDAPYPHEVIPVLKGIFDSAELLVTYNGEFDGRFLYNLGINLHAVPEFDVMLEFAPIYGEWNEHHRSYTWQSLSVCAAYYGYEFRAHDAKEDVLATLYCYKKMIHES